MIKTFVEAEAVEADDVISPSEFVGEVIETNMIDIPEGEVAVSWVEDVDMFNVKVSLPDGYMIVTRKTQFPINVEVTVDA